MSSALKPWIIVKNKVINLSFVVILEDLSRIYALHPKEKCICRSSLSSYRKSGYYTLGNINLQLDVLRKKEEKTVSEELLLKSYRKDENDYNRTV